MNKLYMLFLLPILQQVNRVNKMFQLDRASPVKLLRELMSLYETTLNRAIRPTTFPTWSALLQFDVENPGNYLPVSAVNFGVKFQVEFDRIWQANEADRPGLNQVKSTCKSFLLELLKEMKKRLPSNVQQLESLSELAPSVVLSDRKPQLQKLSFTPLFEGDLNKLDVQWQMISTLDWSDATDFGTEEFCMPYSSTRMPQMSKFFRGWLCLHWR